MALEERQIRQGGENEEIEVEGKYRAMNIDFCSLLDLRVTSGYV